MNPERDDQPEVQFVRINPDGTRTVMDEIQTVQVTGIISDAPPAPPTEVSMNQDPADIQAQLNSLLGVTEIPPVPSLEEVLAAVEAAPVAPSNPLERLIDSFENVEEGSLYSEDVQQAINEIADAEDMQAALQIMWENRNHTDYRHLLFRRVDEEGQNLNRFMEEIKRIPSLPSPDVDFI
jgi:hypothetical protein